jgi:DNA-binding CsgD family transcriptional regulator
MESSVELDDRGHALTCELREALMHSRDLSEVLTRAYGVLSRFLAADYAEMCISKPGQMTDYERVVAGVPPEYFTRYHTMAVEEFVRQAMMRPPRPAPRAAEMSARVEPEQSSPHGTSREPGLPREHVMAVLLETGHDWHGGFLLYRDRRQPFTDRERALLPRIAPILTKAVQNFRVQGEIKEQGKIAEYLLRILGGEAIAVALPATVRWRTPGATALLETWFNPEELDSRGGLPTVLLERLELLESGRKHAGPESATLWMREGLEKSLRVSFVPIPEQGSGRLWGMVFQEVANWATVPAAWKTLLTQREQQVAECVLRGWDNQLITEHLKCSLGTVKKHLQRVFDKLGVDSRAALINKATRS